jgi:hypothetical protein
VQLVSFGPRGTELPAATTLQPGEHGISITFVATRLVRARKWPVTVVP